MFDENGRKFSKWVETTALWEWRNCSLLIASNFSSSHSVFRRLVLQTHKNQGLFGKGIKTAFIQINTFVNIIGPVVEVDEADDTLSDDDEPTEKQVSSVPQTTEEKAQSPTLSQDTEQGHKVEQAESTEVQEKAEVEDQKTEEDVKPDTEQNAEVEEKKEVSEEKAEGMI